MWGDSSEHLLENRTVHDLRTHHTIVIGGLICGVGLLQVLVAWFGVRDGQIWALAAMTAMGLLMLPWWIAMVAQFVRAGVSVSVWDVQPFVWVHAVLWAVGVVLAWTGIRTA